MPMMITGQSESLPDSSVAQEKMHSRRHFTHKRLERWIRLQQFVYGLPDDFSYAVCSSEVDGKSESAALVTVGWMTWYGHGWGADRQHSLALALLEAAEALSSNSTRVFFHKLNRWVFRHLWPSRFNGRKIPVSSESAEMKRKAG